MYERFTDRSRRVMQLANLEAQRFNHEYIGTEHILLGLVKEGSGVAANVLKNLDVDLRKIRLEVEKIVQTGPGGDPVVLGKLPHTPRAKKVIEYSVEEARHLNHNYVGTEHLLLGLLREQEGVAAQVLMNLGLKLEDVREEVLNLLGHNTSGPIETVPAPRSKTPTADRYSSDLTHLARRGKLDRCVGRRAELTSLCEILACRLRPNPLILGEPGAGKATILLGLAQLIADGQVPDWLQNYRLLLLPYSRLCNGLDKLSHDAYLARSAFAEVRSAKDTVLYLPDAISFLGMAPAARRPHAELLQALRSDEAPCILTATHAAYRRALSRRPSLEFLVQPLVVRPLTVDETIAALEGNQHRYESHHGVRISDEATKAIAEAADRHLAGALPGKAVHLLDRVCARARLTASEPCWELGAGIRELDMQIQRLNQQKADAVGAHDFERAAETRNRVDGLRKEKERLQEQLQLRGPSPESFVSLDLVATVVRELAAESNPPPTDGQ